jgi:pilus assembly protein TadC
VSAEIEEKTTRRLERDRFLAAINAGGPSGGSSSAGSRSAAPQQEAEQWQAPIEVGLHQHMALLAARRLRDISLYLLFFAFLLLTMAVGLGVSMALWGQLPGAWGPFSFVAGAFVGVLTFLFFKFMSDTVRALADLCDLARGLDVRVGHMAELMERHADTLSEHP